MGHQALRETPPLLFYKIDRIHSFDIRHSTFCGSAVLFSLVLRFAVSRFCGSLFYAFYPPSFIFAAKYANAYIITPPTAITGIPKLIAAWAATMALSTEAHPFTDQA
jgi:hypothetical protein